MPTKQAQSKKTTKRRKPGRAVSGKRGSTGRQRAGKANRSPDSLVAPAVEEHACIVENGELAYVLVPVQEYEELVKAGMARRAVACIEEGDQAEFVDADELALSLAGERISRARKAAGLTQKQLGARLMLPQSQISRIERNPDSTTVRTLKRIAKALGVDVGALVH